MDTTPPHDITGKSLAGHWPNGEGSERLCAVMERSREIFAVHPVNVRRQEHGHKPASSMWLWGQGRRPAVPTLQEQFGLDGAVISAVESGPRDWRISWFWKSFWYLERRGFWIPIIWAKLNTG